MPGVSAIIVTRGDVELTKIIDSLPPDWQLIIWNNGSRRATVSYEDEFGLEEVHSLPVDDLGVFGRYAAIEYAINDLIYVQDDDAVISNPQAVVDELIATEEEGVELVTNIPHAFRSAEREVFTMLVGFGAAFRRDHADPVFVRFGSRWPAFFIEEEALFHRTCDIIFWALSKVEATHVPLELLPWSYADNRMWRQAEHTAERQRVLELADAV